MRMCHPFCDLYLIVYRYHFFFHPLFMTSAIKPHLKCGLQGNDPVGPFGEESIL